MSIETLQSVLLSVARLPLFWYCCMCECLWHNYNLAGFIDWFEYTYLECRAERKPKGFSNVSIDPEFVFLLADYSNAFSMMLKSNHLAHQIKQPGYKNHVLAFHMSYLNFGLRRFWLEKCFPMLYIYLLFKQMQSSRKMREKNVWTMSFDCFFPSSQKCIFQMRAKGPEYRMHTALRVVYLFLHFE